MAFAHNCVYPLLWIMDAKIHKKKIAWLYFIFTYKQFIDKLS